ATYEIYDEDVTKRACDMLAGWGSGAERPFCMVVGFLLPHNPYVCSPDLFDEYMDRLPIRPDWETIEENSAVQALKASRTMESITPEMARRSRAAYYGLVTTLDRNVGRILDALDAAGLRETTATMYTSDHGDLCGEHGLWCKDSFYDGSVRVPTIWSRPGVFGEGTTIEQATSLVDVAPTVTDLAGAESLPNVRGASLRSLLTGEEASAPPPPVFAETYANTQRPARMVRRGAWKLCHYHGCEQPQLFNLETDPEERCDLGGDDRHAAIRDELHALVLDGWDGGWIERCTEETAMTRRAAQQAPEGVAEVWDFPIGGNRRTE
ncbi:MAG: sulfatase-like hydrolase/transferase, partial [Lentisphaeria bacterium]|nr:sulfatase-like hydrolase/transferase [Lentisphaeria bacterium]